MLPWGWTYIEPVDNSPPFWLGFASAGEGLEVWIVDKQGHKRCLWWCSAIGQQEYVFASGDSLLQCAARGAKRLAMEAQGPAKREVRRKARMRTRDLLDPTSGWAGWYGRKRLHKVRAAEWLELDPHRLP